jgi:hypothetical protein
MKRIAADFTDLHRLKKRVTGFCHQLKQSVETNSLNKQLKTINAQQSMHNN